MKATIKIYRSNADLFYNGSFYPIDFDQISFTSESELNEWIKSSLEPIEEADNFEDIKMTLYIFVRMLCLSAA